MRLPRNLLLQPNGYIHENGTLFFLASAKQTVANAGVISAANLRSGLITQDASGGAVTMSTRTAAQIVQDFPDWQIGEGIIFFVYGNHATNTSTIAGGVGVTLIGGATVTTTGGTFLLTRTGAATFDLIRVG
jgi:hypothetical protein